MPRLRIFGKDVRVRPMLDAIGAQEALEAHGAARLSKVLTSPSQERVFERERFGLAQRRNAAEKKLRPEEHAAWEAYRKADVATRAAAWAMLTDLP